MSLQTVSDLRHLKKSLIIAMNTQSSLMILQNKAAAQKNKALCSRSLQDSVPTCWLDLYGGDLEQRQRAMCYLTWSAFLSVPEREAVSLLCK